MDSIPVPMWKSIRPDQQICIPREISFVEKLVQ